MRDLTNEELARCPADCDYYHIIDGSVYFTNVLGVGVFDIHGNKVDDSILDGVFKSSRPIEKPFDITQHEWSDKMANLGAIMSERGDVVIRIGSSWIFLDKPDGIAIAKALGVTAEDLK